MLRVNFNNQPIYYLLVSTFLLTFLLYVPGLNGPFLLDDFPNLSRLEHLDGSLGGYLLALFDNTGNLLKRPISYLSFIVNSPGWPGDPFAFKLTNLFLHLLIGALLAKFLVLLPFKDESQKHLIIVFSVGLWLLNPLHVSTVLYVVQRMTILAMLFSVLALIFYLLFRSEHQNLKKKMGWVAACGASTILAVLSKENGILTVPLLALLEAYLRSTKSVKNTPKWLVSCLSLGVIVFLSAIIYYAFGDANSYSHRDFTLSQRLFTEGEILARYVYLILVPDVNWMTLYHDGYDWFFNRGKIAGLSFWCIHLSLICIAIVFWKKCVLVGFAIFWFYIGHSLESTIIPLEYMFEHRNYLPGFGLLIPPAIVMAHIYQKIKLDSPWVKVALVSIPLLVFSVQLGYRSAIWGDEYSMLSKWSYYKKNSSRAQYAFANFLESKKMYHHAFGKMTEAANSFENLGFRLGVWRLNCYLKNENTETVWLPTPNEIVSTSFTSEINYQLLLILAEWQKGNCVPQGYTNDDIRTFIDAIVSMDKLEYRPRYLAKVLETVGNFYADMGWYGDAVRARLRLYEVQPTVDTALRNVDFALKFGLFEYAQEFVDKARERNDSLPFYAADRSAQIEMFDKYIRKNRPE